MCIDQLTELEEQLTALEQLAEKIDLPVDRGALNRVLRLRDRLFARMVRQLNDFDELGLYQLTKATSTKTYLEKEAGLSPGEAGALVSIARKLAKMPATAAAYLDGSLSSGVVRAIVANVTPRILDLYVNNEAENLEILRPLTPRDAACAMQQWAARANALVDDRDDKPPREEQYFHSGTLDGRYESKGSFGDVNGADIATALRVAQDDNPLDDDTRSAAERRAAALGDIARFYLSFRNQEGDGLDATRIPKRRNRPTLTVITTTRELAAGSGGTLLDGPAINHAAVEALSCTAQLFRLLLDEDGAVRNYQLMPDTVTDALFNAIAARDQGCRWPGCHKKPWHCDIHHVQHRQHGGKNCCENGCLLCRFHHHRAAHDPSIELHLARDGTLTITYADGTTETTKPPHLQPQLRLGA